MPILIRNIVLALSITVVCPKAADSEIVFSGTPIWRCKTGLQGDASCKRLTEENAIRLKTKILRVGPGKYVWGEDGREIENPGGHGFFHLWQGTGMYIKVWTLKVQDEHYGITTDLPEEYGTAQWLYMEHTQIGLDTITYYGVAEFYLDPLKLWSQDLKERMQNGLD